MASVDENSMAFLLDYCGKVAARVRVELASGEKAIQKGDYQSVCGTMVLLEIMEDNLAGYIPTLLGASKRLTASATAVFRDVCSQMKESLLSESRREFQGIYENYRQIAVVLPSVAVAVDKGREFKLSIQLVYETLRKGIDQLGDWKSTFDVQLLKKGMVKDKADLFHHDLNPNMVESTVTTTTTGSPRSSTHSFISSSNNNNNNNNLRAEFLAQLSVKDWAAKDATTAAAAAAAHDHHHPNNSDRLLKTKIVARYGQRQTGFVANPTRANIGAATALDAGRRQQNNNDHNNQNVKSVVEAKEEEVTKAENHHDPNANVTITSSSSVVMEPREEYEAVTPPPPPPPAVLENSTTTADTFAPPKVTEDQEELA
ncbi:hypothetical protein ACA910_022538 [Epithemia clementina (nom. ined.)]